MQGKTINGFTLQRLLGVGGMAEVWYAENEIGMKAAVKIMSDALARNEQMRDRFLNEAKVMVKLDHPNIRKVYGYGNIDNRPCIIMEYLDGDDLKAMLKRGQRFTEAQLEQWWNQLVDALNYTHRQGIVHRDLKPSNIFVDKRGDVKLLDFGIAKVVDTTSGTMTGSTLGTRIYMSPEQVKDPKRVDHKSDVYSLAVSFVHLLTGKAPYDSTTSSDYEIQVSIVTKPLDLTSLPDAWRNFLLPYLAKEPEQRPELRPFEVVENEKVHQTPDEDEGTVVAGAQPEPERAHSTSKPPVTEEDEGTLVTGAEPKPTPKPQPTPKKKSKTGLWIGIGVTVAAVVLAVLLLTPKKVSVDGSSNGHEYVDLGLPSGTLWTTCNMGATNPEDYGDYYAWGETSTKSTYKWENYKYANGDYDKLTKYCNDADYGNNGFTDNLIELQTGDDPATSWGSGWRTPTKAQWDELLSNTTNQWTTINSVSGRLFTSKKNRQTLFLPAAGDRWGSELDGAGSGGDYWSRSLDTDGPSVAWRLYFYSGDCSVDYGSRSRGFSVRPVLQK